MDSYALNKALEDSQELTERLIERRDAARDRLNGDPIGEREYLDSEEDVWRLGQISALIESALIDSALTIEVPPVPVVEEPSRPVRWILPNGTLPRRKVKLE